MEWIVTTARSVEEAREMALDQLGVAEEDAEFEILEEAKPGLFGRFRKEVRVRARVRPVQPRPKTERRRKRSSGNGQGRGGRKKTAAGAATPAGTDQDATTEAAEGSPTAEAEGPSSERREAGGGSSRGRTRRGRGGRTDRSEENAGNAAGQHDTPPRRSGRATGDAGAKGDQVNGERSDAGREQAPDVALSEHADRARAWVEGLLDAFDIDAEVRVNLVDDETAEVRVDGENLGVLIGPGGATLQAIQTLSRAAVQRSRDEVFEGRVFVEVGGYRQKRKEALERFTRDLVEQVRATGTEKALEPMGSADRKVVHDTVNECEGVRTISVGEEPRRRVVIVPEG